MGNKNSVDEPDEKDIAAIQNYLDWIDQGPTVLKDDLEKFLSLLFRLARLIYRLQSYPNAIKNFAAMRLKH